MKITKQGTPPSERLWVGSCSDCKTEAEARQDELRPQSNQREGSWAEIKCPTCGGRMFFYPRDRRTGGYHDS